MTIRLAKENDRDELKKVKEGLSPEQIKQRLEWQKEDKAVWLVAKVGQELAGYVVVKWVGKPTAPDYPDLEDLHVRADYRGKGIAGQLVAEAESLAKARGYQRIGLAVNPDPRCPAHKLYTKLGHKATGEDKYVDGIYGGVKDWVVDMVKNI